MLNYEELRDTAVTCEACGGDDRPEEVGTMYRPSPKARCRWCESSGVMNAKQLRDWRDRNKSGVRRRT